MLYFCIVVPPRLWLKSRIWGTVFILLSTIAALPSQPLVAAGICLNTPWSLGEAATYPARIAAMFSQLQRYNRPAFGTGVGLASR